MNPSALADTIQIAADNLNRLFAQAADDGLKVEVEISSTDFGEVGGLPAPRIAVQVYQRLLPRN